MARQKKNKHIIDGVKYLEEKHINKLESFHKDELLKQLEIKVIEAEGRALSEKRHKLSAQLEVVNKELEINVLQKKLKEYEHLTRNTSYKQFMEMLKKEYEIEGRFGYDPDTGEIKE